MIHFNECVKYIIIVYKKKRFYYETYVSLGFFIKQHLYCIIMIIRYLISITRMSRGIKINSRYKFFELYRYLSILQILLINLKRKIRVVMDLELSRSFMLRKS